MAEFKPQTVFLLKFLRLVLLLVGVSFPGQLYAATLTVGPNQTFSTITNAIAIAVSGDTIQVFPNDNNTPYHEDILLKSGVIVEGVETARTIIDGTGTANTVTVVNNSTIRNMTIMNTNTATVSSAVFISGVNTATISNNIIVGSETGINCASSLNLVITNNTIDGNNKGLVCSGPITTITFENNIISNNTTGIDFSAASTPTGTLNYNDVYNNGSNPLYTPGPNDMVGNSSAEDPKFVDPTMNDYHLQTDSACLDTGDPNPSFNDFQVSQSPVNHSRNDCGAYGGPNRDTTPFQVQNPSPTAVGTDSFSLSWDANLAYDIADYKVYYDNRTHTIADNVPTPSYRNNLTVAATPTNCPSAPAPPACTISITGLTLSAPRNLRVTFGDQQLFLDWNPPSTNGDLTTSYNVYYKESTSGTFIQIPLGNVNSYTLTGLTNFTTYDIKMTAIASPTYFINLTALDDFTTPNESSFLDPAVIPISTIITCSTPLCESPDSNIATGTPEPVAPFPDLPDQNRCFIATAAYGSPWEPHVRILRAFRDEYLEKYDFGKRFITWYYHFSPPWAQYLNDHPWLKPAVRAALLPAVGVAYFYVEATGIERFLILLSMALLGGMFIMRRMRCRG